MTESNYPTLLKEKLPKTKGGSNLTTVLAVFSIALTCILFGTLTYQLWNTPDNIALLNKEVMSLQFRLDKESERVYRLQKEISFLQSRQNVGEAMQESLRRSFSWPSSNIKESLEIPENVLKPQSLGSPSIAIEDLPVASPYKKKGNKF
ncbi:uncharacterized protein LOC136026557 [Artemia franciscana]|uniref:uncharacterized protein LOC136026557 n=1 Tax=Artemia franciscana TaxID=6661 RepID=UPI0032DA2333